MRYQVRITETAFAEVQEAHDWLAQRSPQAAKRWRLSIMAAVDSLALFPMRCSRAAEAEFLGREIRQLLHGQRHGVYRILFEVRGDTVHVLRVRHASRRFLHEEEN